MPYFYPLIVALLLPLSPPGTAEDLLQAVPWRDTATATLLRFTPDGTFEYDYGASSNPRYLMGRYTRSEDSDEITLGVDYLLGRRRIHPRYRGERDFYLPYAIVKLTPEELILRDLLTKEEQHFRAAPEAATEDPAERRLPKPGFGKLKLPDGWGR